MTLALLAPGAAAFTLAALLGALALAAARHPARGLERLALAFGAGVALLPLLLWASTLIGLPWRAWGLRTALALATLLGSAWWLRRRGRKAAGPTASTPSPLPPSAEAEPPAEIGSRAVPLAVGAHPSPWRLAAWLIVLLAYVLRLQQAAPLVAPAWVDGYHHSVITELVRIAGAVPAGFEPFLEGVPFYYHFGFHALAGSAALVSGATAATAVLATGQMLSAATALTTWALARRMTGSELAAALAAAVPAAWHFFPAYYVSWARYTQLAGLVVLPVAWLLLHEAMYGRDDEPRRRPWPAAALAAAVAAGLLLVHYRVTVFFVLGALVLAIDAVGRRQAWPAIGRLALVALSALALASTWILGPFRRGVAGLSADRAQIAAAEAAAARAKGAAAASDVADGALIADTMSSTAWWSWADAVDSLPRWLFAIELNGLLLVLACLALVLALLAGRRGADALLAWLLLALLLVNPAWLGLPSSWLLPRFALAISAWMPIALAIALGASVFRGGSGEEGGGVPAGHPASPWRLRGPRIAALLLVVASAAAGWRLRDVANPDTVLLTSADRIAMDWVRGETPPDARFLIPTGHWHLGSYRGLGGGYWLPLLAGRYASMPLSFYAYGPPAGARAVQAMAEELARGDALEDADLDRLMDTVGATWIYVGPAGVGEAGALSAARLARHPRLVERYAHEGVTIFERMEGGGP